MRNRHHELIGIIGLAVLALISFFLGAWGILFFIAATAFFAGVGYQARKNSGATDPLDLSD